MSNRYIAEELARKYHVHVREARYREDGKWYHHLEHFPAAYFDAHGYIVFYTKEEYEQCPYLQLKMMFTQSGMAYHQYLDIRNL